jgi:L-fuconolactonase
MWRDDSPEWPWDPAIGSSQGIFARLLDHYRHRPMTAETIISLMDDAGVRGAVVVTPFVYGFDNSYSLAAHARWPERLRVVARIDASSPNVSDALEELRSNFGVVGVRILAVTPADGSKLATGSFDPLLAAAERAGLPVCIYPPGQLPAVAHVARRFPQLQLVLDHLGLAQEPITMDTPPFRRLPELLELAGFPNVALKLTAVPSMSGGDFPFSDIWPHIGRIIEAFTVERLMWGTDITKVQEHHTYRDAVDYLSAMGRLSRSETELIMGGNVRRIFRWPSRTGDAS